MVCGGGLGKPQRRSASGPKKLLRPAPDAAPVKPSKRPSARDCAARWKPAQALRASAPPTLRQIAGRVRQADEGPVRVEPRRHAAGQLLGRPFAQHGEVARRDPPLRLQFLQQAGAHDAGVRRPIAHGGDHALHGKVDDLQLAQVGERPDASLLHFAPGDLEAAEGVGGHHRQRLVPKVGQPGDVRAVGTADDRRSHGGQGRARGFRLKGGDPRRGEARLQGHVVAGVGDDEVYPPVRHRQHHAGQVQRNHAETPVRYRPVQVGQRRLPIPGRPLRPLVGEHAHAHGGRVGKGARPPPRSRRTGRPVPAAWAKRSAISG